MATNSVRLQQDPNSPANLVMAGNPSSGGANACYLRNGDSLQVSIDSSSLPSTAVFSSISFYPSASESASDAATISLGSATSPQRVTGYDSSPSSPPIPMFLVSWSTGSLGQPLTITDADSGVADDSAWFAISVRDSASGRNWRLDPEIVNTGGNKSGWQPSEGATLSRVAVGAVMVDMEEEDAPGPGKKGKGKGKGKAKSKPKGKSKSKPKAKPKGKSKAKPKGKSKAKPKGKSKAKPKGKSKSAPKRTTKSKATARRPSRA